MTPGDLRTLRADVRRWFRVAGLPERRAADLLFAAGEACMNVVQRAYTDEMHRLCAWKGRSSTAS